MPVAEPLGILTATKAKLQANNKATTVINPPASGAAVAAGCGGALAAAVLSASIGKVFPIAGPKVASEGATNTKVDESTTKFRSNGRNYFQEKAEGRISLSAPTELSFLQATAPVDGAQSNSDDGDVGSRENTPPEEVAEDVVSDASEGRTSGEGERVTEESASSVSGDGQEPPEVVEDVEDGSETESVDEVEEQRQHKSLHYDENGKRIRKRQRAINRHIDWLNEEVVGYTRVQYERCLSYCSGDPVACAAYLRQYEAEERGEAAAIKFADLCANVSAGA